MNKQVNKNITNWLSANKICQNISKTEAVLFKSSRKLKDVPLKLKLNGNRLQPTNSVKYLGMKFDENLNWKQQLPDIATEVKHFLFKKTFCFAKEIFMVYDFKMPMLIHLLYSENPTF